MADRVKGITIALSGDTSGLTKSLNAVNTDIKTTKTELKDVERLLKLDPTNTELLAQKQRLLAQSVDDTSSKMDLLKEAEAKMKAEMEQAETVTREQQAAYENLQREIISTNDYLEKDKAALKDVEDAMNGATSKADKFTDALGKVGSKAKTVSQNTRLLSAAAGGALAGIAGVALNGAKAADEFNTLSKQTGLSTDALQEMQYASELIDVSYESFTGSAKKMVGTLRTNEDAFASLGVQTRDASGALLSSDDIYWQTITALGNITNETERDIAAQEIFGRSSAELAGLIDDGGEAFRQYAQEAQDMGLILGGETLNDMNAVNDQVDRLKAQMSASLFAAAAPALEALSPLLEDLIQKLSKVFEWIAQLTPAQMEIIAIVLAVIAAISPVAGLIAGITTAVTTIIPVIKTLNITLSANPIGIVIALIAALAAAIILNWDKIAPILDKLKEKFLGSFDAIKSGFETFKGAMINIINALKEGLKTPINAILGFVNRMIDAVNAIVNNPVAQKIGGMFGAGGFTIPKIPLLASGGTISSGSAIVGERGAELLTMNGPTATVTPLTANVDTSGIERALAGMSGGGETINLALNIDGKQFARATYNATQYEQTRRGGRLVTVG